VKSIAVSDAWPDRKFTVRNQLVQLFARFEVATRTELAQLVSRALPR